MQGIGKRMSVRSVAAAILPLLWTATASAGSVTELTVTGGEFKFDPETVVVEKGEKVRLVFENEGALSHNLTLEQLGQETDTIQSGETDTLTFTADRAGTFRFVCTVPGHAAAGMKGMLRVMEQ